MWVAKRWEGGGENSGLDFRRVVTVEEKASAASEGEIWSVERAE